LVKGNGKPGDGYTAATTVLDQIQRWWEREFPDAGVGGRLDHIDVARRLRADGADEQRLNEWVEAAGW
jgi:hypothetical protein